MVNPFSAFKQYIAGQALANAKDEFERASVNLLMNYGIIGMTLGALLTVSLFLQGYAAQGYLNVATITMLAFVFVVAKRTADIHFTAKIYVIIQQLATVAWGVANNFEPSVEQTLWHFLNTLVAFFVLGSSWGFGVATAVLLQIVFGFVNKASGFAYVNVAVNTTPSGNLVAIVIPFALNVFVMREFVRTRGAAEREIQEAKEKNEELLLNILPAETVRELKESGKSDAKYYNDVTVLFADIESFSSIASEVPPRELVNELHECFKAFDEIIPHYNIEKIKTIGDAYLCASGIPVPKQNHAVNMIKAAQQMQAAIAKRSAENKGRVNFKFRIGIHTGPVVAGVVGIKKFAYDIWGDTVNMAARMQQNGETGRINISEYTYQLVQDTIPCSPRGKTHVKGGGEMEMYFVNE